MLSLLFFLTSPSTIVSMSQPLPSYGEAAQIVAARGAQLDALSRRERVPLAIAAGRVLAAPVLADSDMPAFPRSTRDGFACRAAEASAHAWLALAGSVRAGDAPAGSLPPASAWEIMTGAPVPEGADAVAMLEHVEHLGSSIRLAPARTLDPGENIVAAAAEAHSGQQLIAPGTRLNAAHIAAAASCGFAELEVFARPRVAILATGDELVSVDTAPGPGQIRNSNGPMLAALVEQAGGEAVLLPPARDNAASIADALHQALQSDMLLISGGVSAGKFDLVEPALAQLGAIFHFTGVRIQPGKPLVFGQLPANSAGFPLPFFGLPGNPISSACTFLLFAAPVLARLADSIQPARRFVFARLARPVKGKPDLTRFVPGACSFAQDPEVTPTGSQSSGDLAAFARANCFIQVPEGVSALAAGDLVRILLF